MCVCVCVPVCVSLCVSVGGEGVCVCVCCVAAVQGRARVCVGGRCGVGGRGGAGRECVWVGLHVWRVGRDRGRASQPGKGQRSVCVSGVCVCLWGRSSLLLLIFYCGVHLLLIYKCHFFDLGDFCRNCLLWSVIFILAS